MPFYARLPAMRDSTLLPELIARAAERAPTSPALTYGKATLSYGELQDSVSRFASGLIGLGLARGERVAIYLEKRFETVIASFGAPAAGGVFVPLNPLLKADQVGYIMRDCNVRVLVTSPERLALLQETLPACHDLRHVVVLDAADPLPARMCLAANALEDVRCGLFCHSSLSRDNVYFVL